MANASVMTSVPEISYDFKIVNISKFESAWSPEFMVRGVPWNVKALKVTRQEEQWLSVYLYCAIKDKSPNWSHVASATFKLVPVKVSGNKNGIEFQTDPCVFDFYGFGIGTSTFIKWKELINVQNNYVKDDTFTLDIKIVVADPNDKNPSTVVVQ